MNTEHSHGVLFSRPLFDYESDNLYPDINDADFDSVGQELGVKHLSPGTFTSPSFPVTGKIYANNSRLLVPLVCQLAGKPNAKVINVWFLIVTSSGHTYLSKTALEALVGPERAANSLHYFTIQDQRYTIECRPSLAHFKNVSILGMDCMKKLNLWTFVNWKKAELQLIQE